MKESQQRRRLHRPDKKTKEAMTKLSSKPLPPDFEPEECVRCGNSLKRRSYHVFWDGETPKAECWPCHKFFNT